MDLTEKVLEKVGGDKFTLYFLRDADERSRNTYFQFNMKPISVRVMTN